MRRMILLYLLLLLAFCFLGISCTSKDEEMYVDVLSYYDVLEKIEPTYLIDFTSAQTGDYLLKGWSGSEATHTWAEGLESSFFFYGSQGGSQGDMKMTITCAPFTYPDSPEQSMAIYVNDKSLETIVLRPSWYDYAVNIPNTLLKAKNIITFKYAYAARPSEHLPDSEDQRNLSVMFKKVTLGVTPSLLLKGNRLVQKVGSMLNYYERIPEDAQLKFHFKNKKQGMIQGCVKIESVQHEQESYEYNESGNYTIDLAEYAGKIAKISFAAENIPGNDSAAERNDYIEWSKVMLYTRKGAEKEAQGKDDHQWRAIKEQLKQYDIIYVVLDAFAARHSSAYGYHRKTSPTIDDLASRGMLFENMFAPAPYTLASTASLFTSKYPFEHQLTAEDDKLNSSLMTIAKRLSDKGIATYCASAHPYITAQNWNLTNGFETTYYENCFDPIYLVKKILPQIYNVSSVDSRRKFIYFHIVPPHWRYLPPERFRIFNYNKSKNFKDLNISGQAFLEKIERGELHINEEKLQHLISLYDANILYADEYIRRIVMYLEEHGLMDKVIIVITADHGEAFGEHGRFMHGSTVYDEMIHVPFVMKFPDSIGIKNVRITDLASLIDVGPTILDVMGLNNEAALKGHSLLPAIWGKTATRPLVYSATKISCSVRDTNYKFIYNYQANDELYDISNDPLEQKNIIAEKPIIGHYYLQQLKMLEQGAEEVAKTTVDLESVDQEKIKQLKDLGYMR